jgi:hypothetical protein
MIISNKGELDLNLIGIPVEITQNIHYQLLELIWMNLPENLLY